MDRSTVSLRSADSRSRYGCRIASCAGRPPFAASSVSPGPSRTPPFGDGGVTQWMSCNASTIRWTVDLASPVSRASWPRLSGALAARSASRIAAARWMTWIPGWRGERPFSCAECAECGATCQRLRRSGQAQEIFGFGHGRYSAIEVAGELGGPGHKGQVAGSEFALAQMQGVLHAGARVAAERQPDGGQLQVGAADRD